MVIERYTRKYVEDKVECWSGYKICNDCYNGDTKLPSFMPKPESLDYIEAIFEKVEVEFDSINGTPLYDYIMESMKKLFTGQESDWRIVAIEPQVGLLKLKIANPKLAEIESLLRSLDVKDSIDIVPISVCDKVFDIIDFWILPSMAVSLYLEFFHRREDLGDEVDYYSIQVNEGRTCIKARHKISRSRRTVELFLSDEEDEDGNYTMIGEIEEVR